MDLKEKHLRLGKKMEHPPKCFNVVCTDLTGAIIEAILSLKSKEGSTEDDIVNETLTICDGFSETQIRNALSNGVKRGTFLRVLPSENSNSVTYMVNAAMARVNYANSKYMRYPCRSGLGFYQCGPHPIIPPIPPIPPVPPTGFAATGGVVFALLIFGEFLYVGGSFTTLTDVSMPFLGRYFLETQILDTKWIVGFTQEVHALAADSDFLYIGGTDLVARVSHDTSSLDPAWQFHANNTIHHIVIDSSVSPAMVYVGGMFTEFDSVPRTGIVRIASDAATTFDASWDPEIQEVQTMVLDMDVSPVMLYIGGEFSTVKGLPFNNLCRIPVDSDTADATWNPNVDLVVLSLVLDDSVTPKMLYVGGGYSFIGGVFYEGLARIPVDTQVADSTWKPVLSETETFLQPTNAILVDPPNVSVYNGMPGGGTDISTATARWVPPGTFADTTWDVVTIVNVWAMAQTATDVILGGEITSVNGIPAQNLVAVSKTIPPPPPPPPSPDLFVTGSIAVGEDITGSNGITSTTGDITVPAGDMEAAELEANEVDAGFVEVSAQSFAFQSNLGTTIGMPDPGELAFSIAGSESMRVTNQGVFPVSTNTRDAGAPGSRFRDIYSASIVENALLVGAASGGITTFATVGVERQVLTSRGPSKSPAWIEPSALVENLRFNAQVSTAGVGSNQFGIPLGEDPQKWAGGVAAGTKIYGIPYDSTNILLLDTSTGNMTRTTLGTDLTGTAKWHGGILSGSTIYGIPYNSTNILLIDTITDTATRTTLGATLTGNSKWWGGVLKAGNIYGIPFDSEDILIINPGGATATRTTLGADLSGAAKWAGGLPINWTLADVPGLVGIPFDAPDALFINTDTNTAFRTNLGIDLSGSGKWVSGYREIKAFNSEQNYGIPFNHTLVFFYLSLDNSINLNSSGANLSGSAKFGAGVNFGSVDDSNAYAVPYDASDVFTGLNARNNLGLDLVGSAKYLGIASTGGPKYGIPFNASKVLQIDSFTTGSLNDVNVVGTTKFSAAILGSNSNLYCIPRDMTRILIIDSGTQDSEPFAVETTLGATLTGTNKWVGGAYALGKIYGIPSDSQDILVINPESDSAVRTHFGAGALTGTDKWFGGVLGMNKKLYGIPHDATNILILDVIAETLTRTTLGVDLSAAGKWYGGTLAPNKKIYSAPFDAQDILVIDPEGSTATLTNMGAGALVGTEKWAGSVLGADGRLYMIPYSSSDVLIIDTIAETAERTTFGLSITGTEKWSGGTLGTGGVIYTCPVNATNVLAIDTLKHTASLIIPGGISLAGTRKFQGGVLGRDGCIYYAPEDSLRMTRLLTASEPQMNFTMKLSPLFNKF